MGLELRQETEEGALVGSKGSGAERGVGGLTQEHRRGQSTGAEGG